MPFNRWYWKYRDEPRRSQLKTIIEKIIANGILSDTELANLKAYAYLIINATIIPLPQSIRTIDTMNQDELLLYIRNIEKQYSMEIL